METPSAKDEEGGSIALNVYLMTQSAATPNTDNTDALPSLAVD
jgi:hypothetical protein